MKPTILIVGDYNRNDFLYVAKIMHEYCNIYFLEYAHHSEVKSEEYKKYGKDIFWSEYKNAAQLLEDIKPKIVLFYFIESFNHVALNATCKYFGIKTYHIEHGIRNYEMLEANIDKIAREEKPKLLNVLGKLRNVRSRIKSRLFFQNTVTILPDLYRGFLKTYFRVRSSESVFDTFRKIKDPLRVADVYISFSQKVFEFHQKSDHLSSGYPVYFTGIPGFDFLNDLQKHGPSAEHILFVDNAFEVQHLFGWDEENKIQFLNQLALFAENKQKKLWIKPHPYANQQVYNTLRKKQHVWFVENENSLVASIKDCKIILGFYSTLLMPLMAMNHTVCFSLDLHPAKLLHKPARFLIETGALKEVNSWDDLSHALDKLESVHQEQIQCKKLFIDQWMYKFDGQSSERLKNILLGEVS